jgi:Protein of unknown function (DUF2585)
MLERRLSSALKWPDTIPFRTYALVGAGLIALQALVLLAMGQPPICECGYIKLWHGIVSSPENSQHLTDWYTPSHVIHGFGFYFILWWATRNASMSIGLRFVLAIGLEMSWELLENTPLIINRYRQSGPAQGYAGDSVINSVFDTLSMVLGFALARVLPVWTVVALAVAMEIVTGYIIRDNLLLNIVQLIYPTEFISNWQLGK